MTDRDWMMKAYQQALLAKEAGEVPVGAVLVNNQNQLIGSGRNCVEYTHDPSDHAEFRAIRHAASSVNNHRLLNTTLYVTLEPCIMCAGLIIQSRIRRLVYATRDFKAGAAGSVFNFLNTTSLNHKVLIDEGVLQKECAQLLVDFFKGCRH